MSEDYDPVADSTGSWYTAVDAIREMELRQKLDAATEALRQIKRLLSDGGGSYSPRVMSAFIKARDVLRALGEPEPEPAKPGGKRQRAVFAKE